MAAIQRCILFGVATVCMCSAAKAQYTLSTLATFDGANGEQPYSGLIMDSSGNLYGTTETGGAGASDNYGTVFEVANNPSHTLSTLVTFDGPNGANPEDSLIMDANGNLYGTTLSGGANNDGTAFEVANNANHTLSTLAMFNNTDSTGPVANLIMDASGNLYGTTLYGGNRTGAGTVFEVANNANHTLTTLASLNIPGPYGGLIMDSSGNLYGIMTGAISPGPGTVFEVANNANHTLSTLATLNGTNRETPRSSLIADASGNLYGTAAEGGNLSLRGGAGAGTVFEVANNANHTLSTLATFNNTDGADPSGSLIMDSSGNLYGTTYLGGNLALNNGNGYGTVFEVAAGTHTLTTLATFNGTNGAGPFFGSLIMDASGNLYGTTSGGGAGLGTVFELSPVPEPPSVTLLAIGALAAGLIARRNRN